MFKKILVPVTVVAVLFVGLASSGVASAATTTQSTATTTAHNSPGKWLAAHKKQIGKAVVAVSSTTIGVTPQDLVSELRSGKSIAEVAGEHNVSVQAVSDALVSAAEAKVNQAVTDQKLTSTQASKIEAALPGYVSKLVNHVFGQKAFAHAG
jgi:uncharacterized protein (DUF433 family)